MENIDWLIIDWGTTNLRIFAMHEEGSVVAKIERHLGILEVKEGQFVSTLQSVLKEWLGDYQHLPIYMAGMVGSAQGWVDVPYVCAPITVKQLVESAHRFELPWGATALLVPGVSYCSEQDSYDVMRGEEVQLFGVQKMVSDANFIALFPGTHSKHMYIKDNVLTSFSTFMTGELFSILAKYSILGRGLSEQTSSFDAFQKGIIESGGDRLTNKLFTVRTARLFGYIQDTEVLDYLSGLLIGQELKALSSHSVYLVGNETLCTRYRQACEELGIISVILDGDEMFLNGMLQIKRVNDAEE